MIVIINIIHTKNLNFSIKHEKTLKKLYNKTNKLNLFNKIL